MHSPFYCNQLGPKVPLLDQIFDAHLLVFKSPIWDVFDECHLVKSKAFAQLDPNLTKKPKLNLSQQ